MRDFFINSLEMLISVLIVLLMIGVVIMTIIAWSTPSFQGGGFLSGLFMLIGGGVYVVLTGGLMYLFLGIYQNTKKTAELLEKRGQ